METPAALADLTMRQLDDLHQQRRFEAWLAAVARAMFDDTMLRTARPSDSPEATTRVDRSLPPVFVERPGGGQASLPEVHRVQAGLRTLVAQARDARCLEEIVSLRSATDLRSHAQRVAHLSRVLTGSTGAVIWSLSRSEPAARLEPIGTSGSARTAKLGMRLEDGIAGKCALTRTPMSTGDLEKGAYYDGVLISPHHKGTVRDKGWRSAYFLPLLGSDTVTGVLAVYSNVGREYGPLPTRRLGALAATIEAGLQSAMHADELRGKSEELRSTRTAVEYYQKKLSRSHDAGKKLITLASEILYLRNGLAPDEDGELTRLVEPQDIHNRLNAVSRQIQGAVRSYMPARPGEKLRRSKLNLLSIARSFFRDNLLVVEGERIDLVFSDQATSEATILGNENAIIDCLGNLFDNAYYFTRADSKPGKRTIRIGVVTSDSEACVYVEDDGPGIEESARDRIFEPYYTTKPNDGAGIGLASVQQLALLQDGTVSVESEWGFSSKFTICFPRIGE